MRSTETDHIGNQAMFIMQTLVGRQIDRGVVMPAERFQGFLNELLGIGGIEPTLLLKTFNKYFYIGCKNITRA